MPRKNRRKMIKYCIFDLDGTLLDTLPTIKHYLNKTLIDYGLYAVGDSETKRYIGDGAYQLIFRAFSEQGVTDEKIISKALSEYKAAYDSAPLYLTDFYDGILDALDSLQENGIKIAVLSNKPNAATVSVVRHFFGDRFSVIRGGIDGVPLKPDASSALEIASELGALPKEIAFIGDTSVDVSTGVNMGAALTVGVSWGFREREELILAGADAIADHPSELFKVLEAANV